MRRPSSRLSGSTLSTSTSHAVHPNFAPHDFTVSDSEEGEEEKNKLSVVKKSRTANKPTLPHRVASAPAFPNVSVVRITMDFGAVDFNVTLATFLRQRLPLVQLQIPGTTPSSKSKFIPPTIATSVPAVLGRFPQDQPKDENSRRPLISISR